MSQWQDDRLHSLYSLHFALANHPPSWSEMLERHCLEEESQDDRQPCAFLPSLELSILPLRASWVQYAEVGDVEEIVVLVRGSETFAAVEDHDKRKQWLAGGLQHFAADIEGQVFFGHMAAVVDNPVDVESAHSRSAVGQDVDLIDRIHLYDHNDLAAHIPSCHTLAAAAAAAVAAHIHCSARRDPLDPVVVVGTAARKKDLAGHIVEAGIDCSTAVEAPSMSSSGHKPCFALESLLPQCSQIASRLHCQEVQHSSHLKLVPWPGRSTWAKSKRRTVDWIRRNGLASRDCQSCSVEFEAKRRRWP